MSFTDLGLQDSLQRAIHGVGYTKATPIQAQAIPAILSGSDVMAAAQTGTGKTAGFTLPMLQILSKGERAQAKQVRALVLTPTRELAAQVEDSVKTYGAHEHLRSVVVFGGVNINPQLDRMRKGADILVATPGRLLDLHQQGVVNFGALEILVLDEADRMLDMGFIHDIRRVLKLLPQQRQTLMFSATFSRDIRKLAKSICHQPVEIDVAPRNSTVDAIRQCVYHVAKGDKIALLSTLLRANANQTLVFSRTKHGANKLAKCLNKDGVTATAIHGNKSQNQRTKALLDFKANRVQVMVATDIAARGIDIDLLAQVINFDLPNVSEDYVHRIGRTGRAGATGKAISFVSPEDKSLLRDIERLIKRKIETMELPAISRPEREEQAEEAEARQEKNARAGNRKNAVIKTNNGQRRRRRSGKKPAAKRQGDSSQEINAQNKRRNATTNETGGGNPDAKPKRRRRSRNRKRSAEGSNSRQASGNVNRQQGQGSSSQGGPGNKSVGAMIKDFFSGKNAA